MRSGWVATAGAVGAVGVALGAFGAHALREVLPPERLATWSTAVLYHLLHAVALLAVAALPLDGRAAAVARWAFLLGVGLFSGSLYVLALTDARALGAVTPAGGVAFVVGWAATAVAALRARR